MHNFLIDPAPLMPDSSPHATAAVLFNLKELRVGPIRDSTGSTSSERTKMRVRPSCWWYGVFEVTGV